MTPRSRRVVLVVLLTAGLLAAPAAAYADDTAAQTSSRTATTLTLDGPRTAHLGTAATLTSRLVDADGTAVTQATVRLQRRTNGTWRTVQRLATGAGGEARAEVRVVADDADNVWRARWRGRAAANGGPAYAGDTSGSVTVDGRRVPTTLTLTGPRRVVDEKSVRLTIRWRADDGRAVGKRVGLYRRTPGGVWRKLRSPRVTGGSTTVTVRPRVDTRWRVAGKAGAWHTKARSGVHVLDNVPPGRRVRLPRAPRPRIDLSAQRRAVGGGLNADVGRIGRRVWADMVGRSWHRGCPVGRGSLRLVRMNYWGFDGYRHRGELVVHRRITGPTVRVFRSLYAGRFPVRSMYRVDRFGWSRRLRGANDYRSMAADNTSAFNCRQVVGNPGVRSPHAYGTAIDINPWENPYVSRQGVYPNEWWLHRSHPRVAWRSSSHPVVRAFTRNGFEWGGSYSDFHHFQD